LKRCISSLSLAAARHAGPRIVAALLLAISGAGVAVALEAPAQATSEPASFKVRILSPVAEPVQSPFFTRPNAFPRPSGGADAAAVARLEKYYTILAEKLRAVPGLELITEATPGVPGVPYEIAIRLGADWTGVQIEASSVQGPTGYRVMWRTFETPDGVLNLPRLTALWDDFPAEDPDREMDRLVQRMRLELFPPDRAFLAQKMAEFRDPQLDAVSRRYALHQLMTADSRRDSLGIRTISRTYRPDPALLGAAAEVAMEASDPALRLQIWGALMGPVTPRIDPGLLVAPVGLALATETDQRVQLTLVNILSLSLTDARARAALELVANSADSARPELVRMAARRVLNDGAGWSDYFVTRMNDPQVTDAQRIELINYVYSITGTSRLVMGDAIMRLDEAAERSLASLMKKRGATDVALAAAGLLQNAGGAVARREFIELLRTGTGEPLADNKVRRSALAALAYTLRSHPELRPVFEDVRARDPDPVLREAAQQALDQT
jgi:hypothetical protein